MPDPVGYAFDARSVRMIEETVRRVLRTAIGAEIGGAWRSQQSRAFYLAQAQAFGVAGESVKFKLMRPDGDKGEEVLNTGVDEVDAYIRKGLVFEDSLYYLFEICQGEDAALEVLDPELRFRGVTAEDIAEDNVGDVTVTKRDAINAYTALDETISSLNDLDLDEIPSNSVVEVVFDGLSTEGAAYWRIAETDYECPE